MTPNNPINAPQAHPHAKTRRRFTMPAVVFALLGGHVVFILTAITLATGDRSFAVVPDYYSKAVAFDQRKAELTASKALGWSYALQPGTALNAVGEREVVVVLRDREGQPVVDAQVRLHCYHYARAGDAFKMEMKEILPGQYSATSRLGKAGFWQFDLQAEHRGERFVAEFKQFVTEPEVAP